MNYIYATYRDSKALRFVEEAIERFVPQTPMRSSLSSSTQVNNTMIGDKTHHKETNNQNLDILIALHACDTATDDSLWFGIQRNAKIIVTAPCCHKETRRQLDPYVAQLKHDHPLYDVLRHGIYRERIAESVTDSIRALLLEMAGYTVQVFEFIGGEHTSKNVMITAVKRGTPSKTKLVKLRDRLTSLASMHGIRKQKLGDWMGESMLPMNEDVSITNEHSNYADLPPLPSSRRSG